VSDEGTAQGAGGWDAASRGLWTGRAGGPADGARGTTSVCGRSVQRAGAYGRSVMGSDGHTRGKRISYAVGAARPGASLSQ
jgi:hypothetical protein